MIKLTNLNKYFNKKASNEIHVINNCSLELPKTGLVSFLGPSGCGKTTLLNVIGGLDKASGHIEMDELVLDKYNMRKFDKFRVKNIGYVFQNYLLLPEETIYNNIKIGLNLIDIFDEDEIEKRVNYCLEMVGLLKYKKRKASQLSGGQQQRVSIARALSKDCKIIIADEPTGNLDSNNTVEIMNILKKISQKCLVLLVTHEEQIADFYSDRIIKLKDGKITDDFRNEHQNSLEYKNDKVIYLKDLEFNKEKIKNCDVELFSDKSVHKNNLNMKVIDFNGKTYVLFEDSNIVVLNNKSEIVLKNEHYKQITAEDFKDIQYDTSNFTVGKEVNKFKIFKDNIKSAFNSLINVKPRHKIMYAGFMILGIVFAIFTNQLARLNYVDAEQYIRFDTSGDVIYKAPNDKDIHSELKKLILNNDELDYTVLFSPAFTGFTNYSQQYKKSNYISTNIQLYPFEKMNSNVSFLYGSKEEDGMVIDELAAKKILSNLRRQGYATIEELVGVNLYLARDVNIKIKITGIIKQNFNIGYVAKDTCYNAFLEEYSGFKYSQKDEYELVEGVKLNHNKLEVVISELNTQIKIGDFIEEHVIVIDKLLNKEIKMDNPVKTNIEYKVVGKYKSKDNMFKKSYISEKGAKKYMAFHSAVFENLSFNLTDSQKKELINQGYKIENIGKFYHNQAIVEQSIDLLSQLVTLLIFASIMVIYIYFLMRTRMLNQIYTIGVYRALGANKREVRKKFFYEIIILTTSTNLVGFVLVLGIMQYINNQLEGIIKVFVLNPFIIILVLVVMYAINIFFALLPIQKLIKKTPAEILAKYDI